MIKLLIIDDSAVVRQVMTEQLQSAKDIEVIDTASDPLFALKKMAKQWPDVIILDIEMPRMDGITFLKKIMGEKPTPVLICSTLAGKGAEITMQAMAAGAVDIILKPKSGLKNFLEESHAYMIQAIRAAAQANLRQLSSCNTAKPSKPVHRVKASKPRLGALANTTDQVVAIGTSTGGTQALEQVLKLLPGNAPGIVVVQHMPAQFTGAFAARLDKICKVKVKEAETGDRVIPGQVLIANGGKHLQLLRSGAQYRVQMKDGPLISRHRPSVDVLFRSVATAAGSNALGIIMTGMGSDGAQGLKEMHDAGAPTIAQNEESCVVYGMPKEAVKKGAVDKEVHLGDIAEAIMEFGSKTEA